MELLRATIHSRMARPRDKQKLNVFLDTCIVNRVLDLQENRRDSEWKEDREYLLKLRSGPVGLERMKFFVNPSVMSQIRATRNHERREALINTAAEFKFTEFNMTIFPFRFPARFLSPAQKGTVKQLCVQHPNLRRDKKILADSAFNKDMDVLLTTDRDLAAVRQLGRVKVMLPKELWDYYEAHKADEAF